MRTNAASGLNAHILSQQDYMPFGELMPGRTYGSGYKYGFNKSSLRDDEIYGTGNAYSTFFRELDVRLGIWWGGDPEPKDFQSPYVIMDDNPIAKNDVRGNSGNSVHVDENGKVLQNYDDGDKSVYMHKNGTTSTLVALKYFFGKEGTSAGGKKIGELGGSIDVSTIATNILNANKATAGDLNEVTWVERVLPGHLWDYKSNINTIFGVVWKYDEDRKKTLSPNHKSTFRHTIFISRSWAFSDAAAFGNYNAGYTGIYAGIPRAYNYVWAGLGEIAKAEHSDHIKRIKELNSATPPYGDQKDDYNWNTMGMEDATMELKALSRYFQYPLKPVPHQQ